MSDLNGTQMEKQPLLSRKNASFSRPLLASFLASLMSFSSGTVVAGWSVPQSPDNVGETLFAMYNMEKSSWIVSIYVFGALAGALPAGQISQAIGRKKFLMLLAIPMSLGWLFIMFFVNYIYVIYAGRLLCGLSLGAVTVAVPLYNDEIAPNACRGRGGVFLDFMLCAGILYSYAVSSVTSLFVFSLSCSLIPVVFAVLFSFMPESPKYLYSKGRRLDAKTSLIWLRGENFDVICEFDRIARLQDEIDVLSAERATRSKDQSRKRSFTKAVVLSLALATVQRMTGAGAIIQFTSKLFQISGSTVQANTASIITGIFQLAGSGVSIALIDKVGRRKLLLISSLVVAVCLTMLTIYFYYLTTGMLANTLKVLPIFIVCTYISFFRIGLGPIPWFISSEMLRDDTNNRAQSFVASYSWILSFVVMQTFLPLVDEWPVALWLGYSILSIIGSIFIWLFIPETNNKSKEEVDLALMKTYQNTR